MINYYGLIATNLLVIYLLSKPFSLTSQKTMLISITLIMVIANTVNIHQNVTAIEFIFGFVSYISVSTSLFIAVILFSKASNSYKYCFINTGCAFMPILMIFYISFFLFTKNLFDYGFSHDIVLAPIFIYATLLVFISRKFVLFNAILIIASISIFSETIGTNAWNYIIDPCLLIVCIFEIVGYLIYKVYSKDKATKKAIKLF